MSRRFLVGLIGSNIGQSLAPTLHEDAFAAAGLGGHYHLMDVDVLKGRDLADLLAAARTAGFAGLNITHPFKEDVLQLLDEVAPEAAEIGAANTVVFAADGRATGHNTDRSGFRRAWEEALGADAARGKDVLLLGCGGAGRAVAFALRDLGVGALKLYDQDAGRAAALANAVGGRCEIVDDPRPAATAVAGIVNATPVGMAGYPGVPLSPELIELRHVVADVIYTPIDTEFLLAARARGCKTMNGGGMCVHQAVDAFRHFTGRTPDVGRLKRTFAAAIAARTM